MYHPDVTYRIQFHKEFNFDQFEDIIPYLHQLGIKTIYASPIFAAMPGSRHGYDGINPNLINPEIGTWEQFTRISHRLKTFGMGWLQDFVPNHMAFSTLNPWIYDILEKGPHSDFDAFFDKQPGSRLMVPVLNSGLEAAIRGKDLELVYKGSKLLLQHAGMEYPLNAHAWVLLLEQEPGDVMPSELYRQAVALTQIKDHDRYKQQWQHLLSGISAAFSDQFFTDALQHRIAQFNSDPFLLGNILELQFYRLCDWRETNTRINYRRFFTVNSLICLNMDNNDVFEHYHELLLRMVHEDLIQGIRIDHIDGLLDPAGYLQRLRAHTGPDTYICVEKILAETEQIPAEWPVQGTTGYDFINLVAQVMTNTASGKEFKTQYAQIAQEQIPVQELVPYYKGRILADNFQGELDNLCTLFFELPGLSFPQDIDETAVKSVIAALLIHCPVYRFYPAHIPLTGADLDTFRQLIGAVRKAPDISSKAADFVSDCFLKKTPAHTKDYNTALLYFWRRCMQFSGPLMAKGVEDTLIYNHFPLLAHSEVGGTPGMFGISVSSFHQAMQYRSGNQLTMNATATHDTKRGEDSRARLLQLSAAPGAWFRIAASVLTTGAAAYPDTNDQYFILQVLYGSLPFKGEEKTAAWKERLQEYLEKAAREAKKYSGWEDPDTTYEAKLVTYAAHLSDDTSEPQKALHHYCTSMIPEQVRNILLQLVLKCTCPGIADIYQGTELWDFSFVDPDNRRAVDFEERARILDSVQRQYPASYSGTLTDPAIKMFALHRLLQLRKKYPELFSSGTYESIAMQGPWLSYIRRYRENWIWVILPLQSAETRPEQIPGLPPEAPVHWQDIFTGKQFTAQAFRAPDFSSDFPVMVAHATVHNKGGRAAGVLLPFSALPEAHLNHESSAYRFIDFLSNSGQKFWQMLPLNPLLAGNSFSPYAAASAFAADPIYIDLYTLKAEGWIKPDTPLHDVSPEKGRIAYAPLQARQEIVLRDAWQNFKSEATLQQLEEFNRFRQSAHWLEDYALYAVLKIKNGQNPWYEWPEAYRLREREAIEAILDQEQDAIRFEQWKQFLFRRQWHKLREYAAQRNVKLIGDVPFYMGADSADVWANQPFFNLDKNGRPEKIAGVPPDYFSATGQLWGMPTYNWDAMEQDGYSWWLNRLKDNTNLFDVVRLDHFRAFYDYWQVPAGEQTALNGKWQEGPQQRFFDLLQLHLPDMPFLAEDLGEIHQGIATFKDHYRLPGMYVLQFGFDQYDPTIHHLPHNFSQHGFVYTGTHDNNTIRGWFRQLEPAAKKELEIYAGCDIEEHTVADILVRMAYSSVAETAVIPIQDILNLDEQNRTNTPSTTSGNWTWRLTAGSLDEQLSQKLLEMVRRYNR